MAEQESSRSENASPRRQAEARRKGQVAISRDVPTAVIIFGGLTMLFLMGGILRANMTNVMQDWLGRAVETASQRDFGSDAVLAEVHRFGRQTLLLILPIPAAIAVLGVAAYLVQTGMLWKTEGVGIDVSRINPLAGLKRMLSVRSVAELIKAAAKILVIAGVGYFAVAPELGQLPQLVQYDVASLLDLTGRVALKMSGWIAVTMVLIAGADYAYQRFEWQRSLKMTRQEMKQEQRESEGDPLLRSRVRSLQREMARNRMMAAVPKADVVITNPTHLAVALKYEQTKMDAPVVVAKGAGYIAERIKALAAEHGVMVIENKPVARSLYKLVDIGRTVPTELYRAVAEILALVYRARGKTTA